MDQFMQNNHEVKHWRHTTTLAAMQTLIDKGALLPWDDVRHLGKALAPEQQAELIRHFALRFGERMEDRLAQEIIIESLLAWLAQAPEEKLLQAFLEATLSQPGPSQVAMRFVELAMTMDLTDAENEADIMSIAVSIICELGLAVRALDDQYPDTPAAREILMGHIATYLVSLGNTDNNCIRLSLFNYFGVTEANLEVKPCFSKVMGRFGHTLLDHLFSLLFRKKTEAIALQYLLENLPFVLEADRHSQQILHETMKYYMLKKPNRFGLFIQTLATHLIDATHGRPSEMAKVFLQHVAALLKVASDLNHRELGGELMGVLSKFSHDPYRNLLIDQILAQPDLRRNFRELLTELKAAQASIEGLHTANRFISTKRGRKPSFARANGIVTMRQVAFLGVQEPEAQAS